MIKIENLSHIYQNRDEEAVKNVSLHIQKGESVVIIGSSGSGKSTLLKCINRLIDPASGKVFIDGEDMIDSPIKKAEKIRGKIGMRNGEIVFDGKPDDLTEKDVVDIYGKTKDWYLYGRTGF